MAYTVAVALYYGMLAVFFGAIVVEVLKAIGQSMRTSERGRAKRLARESRS